MCSENSKMVTVVMELQEKGSGSLDCIAEETVLKKWHMPLRKSSTAARLWQIDLTVPVGPFPVQDKDS